MEEKHSTLLTKEVSGIEYQHHVTLAVEHEDLFLFVLSSGIIQLFDASKNTNCQLPPPEKIITGNPTALALSPSHHYAAVGYSDGSIELFDLDQAKAVKVVSKPRKCTVNALSFLNDTLLVGGDSDGNLTVYKILVALFVVTIRESVLATFESSIRGFSTPLINRFVSGSGKNPNSFRCLSTTFSLLLGIITDMHFTLAIVDSSLQIIKQFDAIHCHADFSLSSQSKLFLALSSMNIIETYCLSGLTEPELIHSKSLESECTFLSFMSNSIVVAISDNHKASIIQYVDHTTADSTIENEGYFLNGPACIHVFQDNHLYVLFLQSFMETMESLKATNNIKGAIEQCKLAMANDPVAIIGLPANVSQRSLIISKSISDQLSSYTSQELQETSQAAKVIDFLITLDQELQIQDWIIEGALPIFQEKNLLFIYFRHLIQADPNGTHFTYTLEFVDALLNYIETNKDSEESLLQIPEIDSFIKSLPVRVAPNERLLTFAMKTNDTDFLFDIFFSRLNDIISALCVLENTNQWDKIANLINSSSNKTYFSDICKWVFSIQKSENVINFPRASKLLQLSNEESTKVFASIQSYIFQHNIPFSHSDFLNAFILVLGANSLPYSHPLFVFAECLIIQNNIPLVNSSLPYLLKGIFTKSPNSEDYQDYREDLLLCILKYSKISTSFQETILPLCTTFGFQKAKTYINLGTKQYNSTIKEMLLSSDDPFPFIEEKSKDPEALENLKSAIISNSPLLVVKDLNKLISICKKAFPVSIYNEIFEQIKDIPTQNYFLYTLSKSDSNFSIPQDKHQQYLEFLCKYYPEEVRLFVIKIGKEFQGSFLSICEKAKIWDASGILAFYSGDISKTGQYLTKYLKQELMLYTDSQQKDEKRLQDSISFIISLVEKPFKAQKSREDITKTLQEIALGFIKSFAIPLYILEQNHEASKPLSIPLKEICSLSEKVLPFSALLEALIVDFSELSFGPTRDALMSTVNDYTYDVDTQKSISSLFNSDEISANTNYIKKTISGVSYQATSCGLCHKRLIGSSSMIKAYPCGHIFHEHCTEEENCPICFPVVNIDENNKKDIKEDISIRVFTRNLARFERQVAKVANFESHEDFHEEQKKEIVIHSPRVKIIKSK